ncbi:hypothetical protein KHA80_13240 [Anaerobacillus sp. HL2]|nr:hypothetical protein KHA80_13240 [Anaerobacillus sp. HL2]
MAFLTIQMIICRNGKQDPLLELSVEKLRIAKFDPKIRMEYEDREKALKRY